MQIMPNRMDRGFLKYQAEFEQKALDVLRSGWYILGNEVEQFEKEFYSAGMTKINGKYFSEIYTGTIIPTKSSDFYNKEISYGSAQIVGIAIRQYKEFSFTVLISYP